MDVDDHTKTRRNFKIDKEKDKTQLLPDRKEVFENYTARRSLGYRIFLIVRATKKNLLHQVLLGFCLPLPPQNGWIWDYHLVGV